MSCINEGVIFLHYADNTAHGNHSSFKQAKISTVKNSAEDEFIKERLMATVKVLQRQVIMGLIIPVNFC